MDQLLSECLHYQVNGRTMEQLLLEYLFHQVDVGNLTNETLRSTEKLLLLQLKCLIISKKLEEADQKIKKLDQEIREMDKVIQALDTKRQRALQILNGDRIEIKKQPETGENGVMAVAYDGGEHVFPVGNAFNKSRALTPRLGENGAVGGKKTLF